MAFQPGPRTITLPWPHRSLWPNARVDRRAATKHRRAAEEHGFYGVKERQFRFSEDATLEFVFMPPTSRRFDLDNALAACKAYIDGMAKASRCDDSGWSFYARRKDPWGDGEVVVSEVVVATSPVMAWVPQR